MKKDISSLQSEIKETKDQIEKAQKLLETQQGINQKCRKELEQARLSQIIFITKLCLNIEAQR